MSETMVAEVVLRLAERGQRGRTEADVQSDVRLLLIAAELNLSEADLDVNLEVQSGGGRRIDVEMGSCIIEVKKDLRAAAVLAAAETQLEGYVRQRTETFGRRFVGVLTDGAEWRAYQLLGSKLTEASSFLLDGLSADPSADLVAWLAGILATEEHVIPSAVSIAARLGATSSGYALDRADLLAIYSASASRPEVAVKRQLWSKLLTTALGTQFPSESDELFVEHTFLVAVAEAIAHAVVGFDLRQVGPASLMRGDLFSSQSQILGVVEQDFFDWPLDCGEAGRRWIAAVAARVAQFDWTHVEHDVMKTIYQSVIPATTRKTLGEYYTPDFLAEHMVESAVDDPLHQRVLDPSCGSGTFLFHAVRRFLAAADADGMDGGVALASAVEHVAGVDLHPVAVSLARVTYLLALGAERLRSENRPPLRIPVYLGDSLQWGQRQDLFASESLTVATDDGAQLFADELRFPQALLSNADVFDRLVAEMADAASSRDRHSPHPSFERLARRYGLSGDDVVTLAETFGRMCRLHDEGRDHVWGYFVRNLARPAWLALEPNRMNVLVGNPPWLSYRFMTDAMQATFRSMSEDRGLWKGGSVATQQDLSDLFVVRCVEQYLVDGGSFSFVMPAAALSRQQFEGFRSGRWSSSSGALAAQFLESWDLSAVYPYFFPRTSAVVRGQRSRRAASSMAPEVERWSGSIPDVNQRWEQVDRNLTRVGSRIEMAQADSYESSYRQRFANGATIFPRVLTTVVPGPGSPIGAGSGRQPVRSHRGTYENRPWKDLPDLEGTVESQFVFPVLFGESVLPFRQAAPLSAVLPLEGTKLLDDPSDYPGLADWWRRADNLWNDHRSSKLSLAENLDYRRKLTAQLPLPTHRVVYGASGMHVTACRVTTPGSIVEHQLYWAVPASSDEAHYLCAVLNSVALTTAVAPHMVSGKGGGRHIDKYVWKAAVPIFDAGNVLHTELATLGVEAERVVAAMELPQMTHGALRRRIRSALAETDVGQAIEDAASLLLSDQVDD